MEYNPRYPQPFTLTQAIALDPAVAWDEIARLRNSLSHLKRSQNELQEYLRELASEEADVEVVQAVKENEMTMHVSFVADRVLQSSARSSRASQDERILILKLALTHHGHSFSSEQASGPFESDPPAGSTTGHSLNPNSNGLDDTPVVERTSAAILQTTDASQQNNGVYL